MKKNLALLFIIAVLNTGCISVTKELPAYNTYKLNLEEKSKTTKRLNSSIKVSEPTALLSINNKSINYSLEDNRFESYALSKWSDTPSKMIQNMILEYFSNNGDFKYTASSNMNVRTDYKLLSQIESFQQVIKEDGSFVKVQIAVYLKDRNSTVSYKKFNYKVKSGSSDAKGAVEVFNTIANSFVKELNVWVLGSL
jgi:ABC-type uncharacterized transport system auxiliary subunit